MTDCANTTHIGPPCGPDCMFIPGAGVTNPLYLVDLADDRDCGCLGNDACQECTHPSDWESAEETS